MLSGVDGALVRWQKYINNYFTAYSSILTLGCLKYDREHHFLRIWRYDNPKILRNQDFNNKCNCSYPH